MSPDCDALRELAEKYRALVQMCAQRDAFAAAGVVRLEGEAQRQRHARARTLARRFPGCLRELDGATVAGLQARLAQIEATDTLVLWMSVVWDFHAEMRELLADRRGARVRSASVRMHDVVFEQLATRYGLTHEIVRAIVHEGRCER